jgi:hypothetical protein
MKLPRSLPLLIQYTVRVKQNLTEMKDKIKRSTTDVWTYINFIKQKNNEDKNECEQNFRNSSYDCGNYNFNFCNISIGIVF